MISLAAIEQVNRAATRRSQADRHVPCLIEPEDVTAYNAGVEEAIGIPYIGYRTPRGYRKVGEPIFVDKSGFRTKPTWTLRRFLAHVESIGASYWGTVEEGEFQCYVQRFERI